MHHPHTHTNNTHTHTQARTHAARGAVWRYQPGRSSLPLAASCWPARSCIELDGCSAACLESVLESAGGAAALGERRVSAAQAQRRARRAATTGGEEERRRGNKRSYIVHRFERAPVRARTGGKAATETSSTRSMSSGATRCEQSRGLRAAGHGGKAAQRRRTHTTHPL